jgi:HD superfamily phosphohydrolase
MEKVFRDPVHDAIVIRDPLFLALVDTPEFQRLRRIRQLGLAYGTYPGAEHSRFSHSLGTYHLACLVAERLALAPEERRLLSLAALVHDLGHGPFSHVWERTPLAAGAHEEWTWRIIRGPSRVAELLSREEGLKEELLSLLRGEGGALGSLISGPLDLDRMDYLLRDALFTGATYGRFDVRRLVSSLVREGGEILVEEKGLASVEEYLLARYFMYWRVYFHKTIRAHEIVLSSLLLRARDLGREARSSPPLTSFLQGEPRLEDFLLLDDGDIFQAAKEWAGDPDPWLSDLARRFLERRLLKPVFPLPVEEVPPDLVGEVKRLVEERGFPPRYYFAADRALDLAYDYYLPGRRAIFIRSREGEKVEVSRLSPLVASLARDPRALGNLYVPEECRREARGLLGSANITLGGERSG